MEAFNKMKPIEIKTKSAYGQTRIYPVNETGIKLAGMMGRKTFNKEDLETLKTLGFEVIEVKDPSIFD